MSTFTGSAVTGSISAADILTYVNDRLGMELSDIDTYLEDVLEPLSKRGPFIPEEADIAFTDGTATVACPTDYLFPQVLHLESDTILNEGEADEETIHHYYEPMERISIQDYNYAIRNETSIPEGTPTEYAIWDNTIYPYPVPDGSYTGKFKYFKRHARSTTISFPVRFRNAIQKGVTAEVAKKYELWAIADRYTLEFEREVAELRGIHEGPGFVKHNDI